MASKSFLILSIVGILAFTSKNNFGDLLNFFPEQPEVINKKEADSIVQKQIIYSIEESLKKKDPGFFMTKCYNHINYKYNADYYNKENAVFEKSGTFEGYILLTDCSTSNVVGEFRMNLKNNEFSLRESYFSNWESVAKFCSRIEKSKF